MKDNALEVCAEELDLTRFHDLLKKLGQAQATGVIARQCSFVEARLVKQLKEAGVHKHLQLTWDEFCARELHMSRNTADRLIQNVETLGEDYFAISQHVRIAPSTFQALDVKDGKLLIDGNEVAITRDNRDVISQHIEHTRRELAKRDEQLGEKEREAKKYKAERDEQKRAAENANSRLRDIHRAETEAFAEADADHRTMLLIQSKIDGELVKLHAVAGAALSPENQGRAVALVEYLWREFSQVAQMVRDNFGIGENVAETLDEEMLQAVTPNAADLVAEYRAARKGKGKGK